MATNEADIGLIGLAVMGQNLVMNMNDHGFRVAVFNRTVSKVDDFLHGPAKGSHVIGTRGLKEFVTVLKRPRKIILMVKAGVAVDELIAELLPFLEKGDILIDGGNSHYPDTERRVKELDAKGILFVGSGISGGEEGARHGPSIMPGGNAKAWSEVAPILQTIAAKAEDGKSCCDWVGDGGSGHYVKMVHNGIEYGDMQLICEAYHILKARFGCSEQEMHDIFLEWNKGPLHSYLIEITAKILAYKEDGKLLLDSILDVAGQKGTGKWTGVTALELGMPLTLIGEAVFARCLSALKAERLKAAKLYGAPHIVPVTDKKKQIAELAEALYASKMISYAQGFMLMRQAAADFKWKLNYGSIALMWREGCIIRSQFLYKIKDAFTHNPQLENLLLDPFFHDALTAASPGFRRQVALAIESGIPTPCLSTAINYFDGYRTAALPTNLLQAQRDFFGAHTYERTDRPRGQFFHTNWTGTGGNTSSSTYNV